MIKFILRILRAQSYMSGRRMLLSKFGLNNHRSRSYPSYRRNGSRHKKVSSQTTPEFNPYDENVQEETVSQKETPFQETKQLNHSSVSTDQNSEHELNDNPYEQNSERELNDNPYE